MSQKARKELNIEQGPTAKTLTRNLSSGLQQLWQDMRFTFTNIFQTPEATLAHMNYEEYWRARGHHTYQPRYRIMAELTAFSYRAGTSLLHRVDARFKLLFMVLISMGSLHGTFLSLFVTTLLVLWALVGASVRMGAAVRHATQLLTGEAASRRLLPRLRDEGRFVDHLGVAHLAFAMWEPAEPDQTWTMVAPPPANPVEVFTKWAPAALARVHALIFSLSSSRQVSMITFTRAARLSSVA